MDICRNDPLQNIYVINPDGTKSPIKQEKVADFKKTLGIHDSPKLAVMLTICPTLKAKHVYGYIECKMDISQAILLGQHTNTNFGLT